MDTQTADLAAKLGAIPMIQLVDGYDRTKHPRRLSFRSITLDEIRRLHYGQTLWIHALDGKARQVRVSSNLKTWKRDPDRMECSFKFGLYEAVRWNTREMLSQLLIPME